MEDYFISGLEVLQNDAGILEGLLKKTCPPVYRHLQKHKVEPLLYMTDWFLCAMTRTLPWETLLRVWDCFLAEGIRVIFKVALVILGASLNSHKIRKQCNGLCETLEVLRNPPDNVLDEDFIINHMQRLNLRVEDFQIEHTRQKARRAKQKALQEMAAAQHSNTSTFTRSRNTSPTNMSTTNMSTTSTTTTNAIMAGITTTTTTAQTASGNVTVVNISSDHKYANTASGPVASATSYMYGNTTCSSSSSGGGVGVSGVMVGATSNGGAEGGISCSSSNGIVSVSTNNHH